MGAELTIAIPSYDRCRQLSELLTSIAASVDELGSARIDVVVALDGSSDGSAEMVAALARSSTMAVRAVWQPNAGLAAARNLLVREVTSPLIWLVDDDMIVTTDALRRHLAHDRTVAPVLVGPCDVVASTPEEARLAPYYEERHRRLARTGAVTSAADCSFANTSAPTSLLATHAFDEGFTGYGLEDTELGFRLLRAGVRIAFDPAAAIEHHCRPPAGARLTSMREAGRNMVRFAARHPADADVAFDPSAPWPERALWRLARPVAAAPLWALARLGGWASARWGPARRGGGRLAQIVEAIAVAAGIAAERGEPAGPSPAVTRRRPPTADRA